MFLSNRRSRWDPPHPHAHAHPLPKPPSFLSSVIPQIPMFSRKCVWATCRSPLPHLTRSPLHKQPCYPLALNPFTQTSFREVSLTPSVLSHQSLSSGAPEGRWQSSLRSQGPTPAEAALSLQTIHYPTSETTPRGHLWGLHSGCHGEWAGHWPWL